MSDDFVTCFWECLKCSQHGQARQWQRKDETRDEAARRNQSETRARCVKACRYTAATQETLSQ